MKTECFIIVPTGTDRLSLRRYADCKGTEHGPNGYHNAFQFWRLAPTSNQPIPHPSHELDLWPHRCECGYIFQQDDNWQVFADSIYKREDGVPGEVILREAPVGAMWDAFWHHDWRHGDDGKSWMVKLPDGGEWFIDGPAASQPVDSKGWTRTGTAPKLTVQPSCQHLGAGGWHGFLTDGFLTDA